MATFNLIYAIMLPVSLPAVRAVAVAAGFEFTKGVADDFDITIRIQLEILLHPLTLALDSLHYLLPLGR